MSTEPLALASCRHCRNRFLPAVQDETCPHGIRTERQLGEGTVVNLAALATCRHCSNRYLPAVQDAFCPHRISASRHLGDGSGTYRAAMVLREQRKPGRDRSKPTPPRPPLVLAEPLWGPQLNEHPKRYEAALIYFELGLERSCRAVAARLPKSHQLISRWAREDKWDVRAQSYDVAKALERRALQAKLYRKEIERQLKAYQGLQFVGVAGVAELMGRVERGEPLDLSPDQILKFVDLGIKGARLVLGDATEHTVNETVTPQMVYERRLRDAVMDLRDSEKTMPEVPLPERVKWAVEDYKVSMEDLQNALGSGEDVDNTSEANN